MSTQFGIAFSEIYPQPGFSASFSPEGGWTGVHSFMVSRQAWNSGFIRAMFAPGTQIGTLDPGIPPSFSFLRVVDCNPVFGEGDLATISVNFAGSASSQFESEDLAPDALPTYRLTGQLQEAPFSEHPKWIALTQKEKDGLGFLQSGAGYELRRGAPPDLVERTSDGGGEYVSPKLDQNFQPYTFEGDALEFANLIVVGSSTYLRPSSTWTETTQGTSPLTSQQINKLGHISNPRGNPPEPNGGRDWMLTGISDETYGELHSTAIEWTLSERGGFNAFLYDT